MEDQRAFLSGVDEHWHFPSDSVSFRFCLLNPCILHLLYVASRPEKDVLEDPFSFLGDRRLPLHRVCSFFRNSYDVWFFMEVVESFLKLSAARC